MKHHIMIAFGILLAGIFLMQGMSALVEPGLGLRELYIVGGFVFSGLIIRNGLRERRFDRQDENN